MEYHITKLPSGLKVVTVPMENRKSAAVAIWVRVGSRFESKKLSGVSHYLEHMLFKGTKKRSTRRIKEEIEGVGGVLNAFTCEESTCYFAKLLREHLPKALDVLADMVLNAMLLSKEIEKERTVILEEIKMYRDLPAQHVHDLMGELLWPAQPLGAPIAGTEKTVGALTRSEIAGFMKRYYQPSNIVVSVSGAMDHDSFLAHVEDYFPRRAAASAVSRFDEAVSRQAGPRTLFMEKDTEQTHFCISFHSFSRKHPDRYKLAVLNIILGSNMSSRLFEEVREKRGLAYEIKSGTSFYEDAGSLSISAGVETKKTAQAVRVILNELEKLMEKPVSAGELRRAKDYFLAQVTMGLEDTLDHLLWAADRAVYRDDMPDLREIKTQIEAVTARDLQEVAKKIFCSEKLNLTLIGPVAAKVQNQIKKEFQLRAR